MLDQAWAEDFVRRGAEAFNRRDWEVFKASAAPKFHFWSPVMQATDPAEVLDNYQRVVAAVPDLSITVRTVIWDGERRTLAVEQVEEGTNTGDFSSAFGVLPATGGPFHMRNVIINDVTADGLVTDMREYFDLLGVMRQLGAL